MRKKEVVEDKSASNMNYEKKIMRYVPFAATIPYTYLHVYISYVYMGKLIRH